MIFDKLLLDYDNSISFYYTRHCWPRFVFYVVNNYACFDNFADSAVLPGTAERDTYDKWYSQYYFEVCVNNL